MAPDYEKLRSRPAEKKRPDDLPRLLPRSSRALDIGAREGFFSRVLARNFDFATAIDIEPLELVGVPYNQVQRMWTKPHGNWIHVVFRRNVH